MNGDTRHLPDELRGLLAVRVTVEAVEHDVE